MVFSRLTLALLVLVAISTGLLFAEEKKPTPREQKAKWARALATFNKFYRSREAANRAQAAQALGQALAPGTHLRAARLLLILLQEEIARSRRKEEHVRYIVVEAVVESLRLLREHEALAQVMKVLNDPRTPARMRFHIYDGMAASTPVVLEALCRAAKDPDTDIRIVAMETLAGLRVPSAIDTLLNGLEDPAWQVRIAAVRGLARLPRKDKARKDRILGILVAKLSEVDAAGGRFKYEVVKALEKVSGARMGFDAVGWEGWLARYRKGGKIKKKVRTKTVFPVYHGLRIWSTRVVFVIDITGSMADPATETGKKGPPAAKPRPQPTGPRLGPVPGSVAADRKIFEKLRKAQKRNDKRVVRSKMDAEKKELIAAILQLDRKVHFTIVFYSGEPLPWRPVLVPATPENKLDAVLEIEKVGPLGGTNIFKALMAAFRIVSAAPKKKGKAPAKIRKISEEVDPRCNIGGPVDEIFLLTDGCPTVGRITDPERLREEVRKMNRLRRIRINAIAVGVPGQGMSPVDLDFLRKLALENGGGFVHVK